MPETSSTSTSVAASTADGAKRQRIDDADPSNGSDDTSTNSGSASALSNLTSSDCLLPPEVLAHVFNYLLYGELRRCLLAGRVMAFAAAKEVTVLNTTRAGHLNVGAAKNRFPNVEEVNVFSLFRVYDDDEFGHRRRMSVGTTSSVVFFLQSFPVLKRVWIGGADRYAGSYAGSDGADSDGSDGADSEFSFRKNVFNWYNVGNWTNDDLPENHLELMKGLVMSFCGAFRVGALPKTLALDGIIPSEASLKRESYICQNRDDDPDCFDKCALCQQVRKHFPFHLITKQFCRRTRYCFNRSRNKVIDIISKRRGGLQYLASEDFFSQVFYIRGSILGGSTLGGSESSELRKKLLRNGYNIFLLFMDDEDLNFIETLAKNQCSRSKLNPAAFTKAALLTYSSKSNRELRLFIEKRTFDFLTSAGVAIDTNRFIVMGGRANLQKFLIQKGLGNYDPSRLVFHNI